IFIDAGRVKGFSDGPNYKVEGGHHVVGMDASRQAEVFVADQVPEKAVGRGLKPGGGQRHDENGRAANDAADYHHSVSGKALGERADKWNHENDQDVINIRELSDGSAAAQFADAEGGKDVVRLHD